MSSFKLACLSIVSLLASIVLAVKFRLVFTLPLILLGTALLLAGGFLTAWQRKMLALISYNLGFLSLFIGIIASLLNLKALASPPEGKRLSPDSNYTQKQIQKDIGTNDTRDQGLGYRFEENSKDLKAKLLGFRGNKEEVIYDVRYNINQYGNRYTPGSSLPGKAVLFLGDSFTFGEGIHDHQTFPYYFQKTSGIQAINAGMHGYGPHQVLRILEDNDVFKQRTENQPIAAVVYRIIFDHINRGAGYSPWDPYGPYYDFTESNDEITYKGNFFLNRRRSNAEKVQGRLGSFMELSSEPWTAKLGSDIKNYNYSSRSNNFEERDVRRFFAMIKKMHQLALNRGVPMYLIIEDFSDPPACTPLAFSKRLEAELDKDNIPHILTSQYYDQADCRRGVYHLHRLDGHPTAQFNQLLAKALTERFFNN